MPTGGVVSASDQLAADPLPLALHVDREVGEVCAEGAIGNRPRNSDKFPFLPGGENQSRIPDHLFHGATIIDGPPLPQGRAHQDIDELVDREIGLEGILNRHSISLGRQLKGDAVRGNRVAARYTSLNGKRRTASNRAINVSRKVERRMDAEELRRFRRSLLAWYDRAARDLPWRRTHDPYRIWISEIMLQQTTVVAVIPYFERFLARYPTVQDLAQAEEEQVLRLWEGLGYYSRARNLHRAARVVVEQHAGEFPRGVETLHDLPGVGRYTAGAIASFAFDERAPIVEANTQRLYCRLLGYASDPKSAEGQRTLWQFAEDVLPSKQAGRFNQALMELGATVCTPKSPDCESCPVKAHCRALAAGLQHAIPKPAVRPETTDVTHAAAAIRHDGRWLLRQCGVDERWAGLWDFPRIELAPADAPNSKGALTAARTLRARKAVEQGVARLTGLSIEAGDLLHQLRHTVTRYRIRLLCFHGAIRATDVAPKASEEARIRWVHPDEFSALPLSMTGRKLAEVVQGL